MKCGGGGGGGVGGPHERWRRRGKVHCGESWMKILVKNRARVGGLWGEGE